MKKFGVLKEKIFARLNEAYVNGNKNEIKEILTTIVKNKDFRERYLFYEEIENKYINGKEDAHIYVSEVATMLMNRSNEFVDFCKSLDKKIGKVVINENKLYSSLDTLSEKDTLRNVNKKLEARMNLVEHLTTKKEQIDREENTFFTPNENLLHNVLANNFNVLYNNTLTEEQKEELKKILAITTDELKTSFTTLKEDVTNKMNSLLAEEKNDDVKKKVEDVLTEIATMDITKFNYYKLSQLKNGL